MTSLRLLGTEVLPEMRKWAKELGLTSPDEVKPGSRPLPANGKRLPVPPVRMIWSPVVLGARLPGALLCKTAGSIRVSQNSKFML